MKAASILLKSVAFSARSTVRQSNHFAQRASWASTHPICHRRTCQRVPTNNFTTTAPSRASETSTPPEDPENDPGNILRRLAETPEAMASIMKLMTVIKEEGGIDIGQAVREDGSVDPNAMGKRPSMFEMARMMMNGKIRDAVKEVHAELMKAGIELTPERVSAILQADELIRGLKK
ncbi:unnamed protein product [Tilletia laevis]|uniref:Uncharacterized protein n=1 Tax=Tilletia caries TaxID=13290 RepID=A0ABN7J262_9BASI|nr:unnamed protein product [Tilletia caries]CAD6899207.1 unnamed protein product [Tilletia laevis]CAD6939798.1 unnamed protein product [Tilletia caries]CAD7067435.1 unnamed protein product [Tilletia caries]